MNRRSAVIGLACWAALFCSASAQQTIGADLNVSPRRITFEGGARADDVIVFNSGAQAATYNVDLADRVMTPDGGVVAVADTPKSQEAAAALARLKSAKTYVTFTPRRVTLGPGEYQTIRLRVLRPADLPPGEYRTHLTVTATPPEDQGLTADQAASAPADGSVGVRLTALFSVAIPVIVRQGANDAAAGVGAMRYAADDPAKPALNVEVQRKGQDSLYLDLEVRDSKQGRSGPPLGLLRGFAVYSEVDKRSVNVPLNRKVASGDRLEVVLKDADKPGGRTLATGSFVAP
jgi:P pilus assembly chaperone PapD